MTELWTWRELVLVVPVSATGGVEANPIQQVDVTDFEVEATDGRIGKVDEATYDTNGSYLVVDTGWWIFGKKRLIPAGLVDRVDSETRTVHLRVSKDQVKDAPDYDDGKTGDWRSETGEYYGT